MRLVGPCNQVCVLRGDGGGLGCLPVQNAEQVQQNNRDDRHAEQPKQDIAPHRLLAECRSVHRIDGADGMPVAATPRPSLDHVEDVHQDDDADRHANEPQENTAHFFELRVVAGR
jgi:hypothetical protein